MDIRKTGRLISKKRKALELTQEQLSTQLHVTPQAISLWETGQRYPDPAAQVMLFKVLGLNPVELLIGLEMFDDDLKAQIAQYMNRIDGEVVLSGMATDEAGNEFPFDLSAFSIVTTDGEGEPTGKWVPLPEYYNVEPDQKDCNSQKKKSPRP